MNYQCIMPPESLKHFVRCFWIFEGIPGAGPYVYRSMADGCAELLFHYKGVFTEPEDPECQFYSGLQAQTKQFQRFITCDNFGIFGAYLYPYAIPLLFNISSQHTTDARPDLQTLLGREGRVLEDKMLTARNNSLRLTMLTRFLEKRLLNRFEENAAVFSAIRHVIESGETTRLPALSNRFCMTERTLQRHFKEYAGLGPKLLSRISRFKTALNDYGNHSKPLSHIAYDCGYYDQSHFINDFKSFSGYHPKEYFHGRPEGVEWRES